jgi:hypothetical protein
MLGRRNGIHSERYALIEQLMEKTPLEFWGDAVDPQLRPGRERTLDRISYGANRLLRGLGATQAACESIPLIRRGASWTSDPSRPSITQLYPKRCHSAVFGLKNYQLLARSRLVFNSHIDCSDNYAGNLRLYEATGMGACLLTDAKINLSDMFEPGVEVVSYSSVDECVEKALYLLEHEEERRAIAEAGQRRTLRDHTYAHRAAQLNELINELLSRPGRRRAPAYESALMQL